MIAPKSITNGVLYTKVSISILRGAYVSACFASYKGLFRNLCINEKISTIRGLWVLKPCSFTIIRCPTAKY